MGDVVRLARYGDEGAQEMANSLQRLVDDIRNGEVVAERIVLVIHHADGSTVPHWFGRSARRYEAAGLFFAGAQQLLGG